MIQAQTHSNNFPIREDRAPIVGAGFSKYIASVKPNHSEADLLIETGTGRRLNSQPTIDESIESALSKTTAVF